MPQNKYIGFMLYRAYIEEHPALKHKLQLCGQHYLGLAFNLDYLSPIIIRIIQFLEPDYIIYLVLNDNYSFIKDPLFSHIIHLNNMIGELSPMLQCQFCTGNLIKGAGCSHYKLDCKLHNKQSFVRRWQESMQTLFHRYYPCGERSWVLDWDLYITIGNVLQDNWRQKSWELRRSGDGARIGDGGGIGDGAESENGYIIKNYFYTYYYWWNDDDYTTFIQTCSNIMVE